MRGYFIAASDHFLYRDGFRLWVPTLATVVLTPVTQILAALAGNEELAEDVRLGILISAVVFMAVFLVLAWLFIVRSRADVMRTWARREEKRSTLSRLLIGRSVGLLFALTISGYGLLAAFVLAATEDPSASALALGGLGVGLSWLTLQTSYALYYGYVHHRDGGLDFPGDEGEPEGIDFAYFAFAVGTTFAASDVDTTTRRMRRVVLVHGVLSFVYNSALIALAINVLAR